MKKAIIATTLLVLTSLVAIPKPSTATLIPLFIGSDPRFPLIGMGEGEGRWTYFELLNDVTITQLGAVLDPDTSNDIFEWEIYSTEDDVPDSPSEPVGALIASVFDTTMSVTDIGLATYDTNVSVPLTEGFYALSFVKFLSGDSFKLGTTTNNTANYPNPTIDSNFRVWDGASSTGADPPQAGNNLLLPQFSVNIEGFTPPSNGIPDPPSIPEPATILLLSIGLIGLAGIRRKFKK